MDKKIDLSFNRSVAWSPDCLIDCYFVEKLMGGNAARYIFPVAY